MTMRRWLQRRPKSPLSEDPSNRSSTASTSATATSARKTFPSGIKLLHDTENGVVDIIFVHGLTGDREKTWTAKEATSPWPQSLLPSKIPNARVLTFGYDAYVVDWRGVVSKNRIGNHAMNLLTSVATYRDEDGTNERPIIFVCHSLGGLVCEDALSASRQRPEKHLRSILDHTRGIVFLGTPHHGSALAQWAEKLAKTIGVLKQTNPQILETLRSDSEVLARVQDGFHTMVRSRNLEMLQPIDITCFFEELPIGGIGVVVPLDSAILPGYVPIGIRSNHIDMTKFEDLDDPGFIAITGEIRRWTRELAQSNAKRSSPPLSPSRSLPSPFSPPISQAISSETSEPIKDTDRITTYEHPSQITPLYLAVRSGDEETVELLLKAGISADEPCYGAMPPLCVVGQTGNLKIAKLLIDAGANLNAWKEKPLFSAATMGHTELVKLLLASGANPDAPKPDSWTALHTAMVTCHPEIAEMLINAGADVNATSITGATPLMIAAKQGYTELVTILLAKGAKTDPVNPEGFTALKIALANKQAAIVRALVNAGATK